MLKGEKKLTVARFKCQICNEFRPILGRKLVDGLWVCERCKDG